MIMRANAWCAIVAAARAERGAVESIDGGAVPGKNRHMHGLVQGALAADPEIRLAVGTEPGSRIVARLPLRSFHDETIAEGRQSLGVEVLRPRIIGNRKSDMID